MTVPTVELRPGSRISRLIRGGWQLSGDHGDVDADQVVEDMAAFHDAGITTFDCADIYTGVEALYGAGLSRLAETHGPAAAQAMKIHTKYVPDIARLASLTPAETEAIVRRSLDRLGRARLDLVQFHWWDYAVPGWEAAVDTLARLQSDGLIDRIGLTNFDADHTEAIAARVDVVSTQVQFSLLDRRPAGAFADMCRARGIAILCYGVLAGGFLTDAWRGRTDPGFAFENRSLVKYRLIVEEFGGWTAFQALLDTLHGIALREEADISAVAIRAMLEDPDATAVIVGARSARHLPRLARALAIDFTAADRALLDTIVDAAPGPAGAVFALERDRDGRHGRIMKYNLNAGA